jgi:hypothetical protein
MTNRLEDVLAGRQANCIVPLFWQRGEDESVIREEMARVHAAGIGAVCVEARPHPDFLGPRWWRDMDVILDEARARAMRVWVFDDDHFPTGHAAGKLKDAPPELQRLFLREVHLDALGPRPNASFLVKPFLAAPFFWRGGGGETRLLSVIAACRDAAGNRLTGEFIDLTGCIQGDALYWDVPEGCWRIFFLTTATRGGSEHQAEYLNPLVPASVKVLLDTVYEPFYDRYKDDFGQAFAGFFSDEPGFYNEPDTFNFQSGLGRPGIPLPWRADLLERLAEGVSDPEGRRDPRLLLPLLWHAGDAATGAVRYAYMDLVSRLYGECFTQQIGDWCRARGVEYIGHVLEDNGVHARLGSGAGHYFRALWGQDMAGLDVVLWQLAPGLDGGTFANVTGEGDGEFFHYGLGKLGASLAHLDPKKRGRALCEVFGAYGWAEGLKLMKWITDHMLVRGVNVFMPHAFSQAAFPDPDCPPHFYARGQNPQYRFYSLLNDYTNRASHLLSGGLHVAPLAVLYHAEAEWAGDAMPFHQPVRRLLQRQIDCDVLPADLLLEGAALAGGRLQVNGESYRALVVPYSQALPEKLLARLAELAGEGLPVVFVDRLPERPADRPKDCEALARLAALPAARAVPLEALAQLARAQGWPALEADGSHPYLRVYHVRHPGLDVYLFTNEHPHRPVETYLALREQPGPAAIYDAFDNQITRLETTAAGGGLGFPLTLSPYESRLVVCGPALGELPESAFTPAPARPTAPQPAPPPPTLELRGPWRVSTAAAEAYPLFTPWQTLETLSDLGRPAALPGFSGTIRYEMDFAWPPEVGGPALLDLGEAYETVEVWLNGQPCGARLCPPYRLALHHLRPGENALVIEVTNTLVKAAPDFFSRAAVQEPSGLLGPVQIGSQVSFPD